MPEIGEVARVVHFLKKHLVNKKIISVEAQEDNIIYGKVGTSAAAFKSAMTGRTVLDARQQGKYFWLVMDSPPHPVMHLGMTGWIKFSNDDSSHYRPQKEDAEWPPRFWKFLLKTDSDSEVAFIDARRLARIRLVDAAGEDLRKTTPLKENGPDPVIDTDVLTLEWFSKKMRSKKVPVKALLLDQANISGVGNWVADEVLYQARVHPEQYSNTFSDEQLKTLHSSLLFVCKTACDLLAESDKFPEDWLMKYRWDKGKKGEVNVLPNGNKIVHLKVGGRTSAIVPSVQKKTGAVAGDISGMDTVEDEGSASGENEEVPKAKGRKRKVEEVKVEEKEDVRTGKATKTNKGRKKAGPKAENGGAKDETHDEDIKAEQEKPKKVPAKQAASSGGSKKAEAKVKAPVDMKSTNRRSTRLSGQGSA